MDVERRPAHAIDPAEQALSEQELDDEAAMDLPDREEMSVLSSPGDFMMPIDPTPIHLPPSTDPLPTPE